MQPETTAYASARDLSQNKTGIINFILVESLKFTWQLGGQTKILIGDLVVLSLIPGKKHSHLKCGHIEIVATKVIDKRDGAIAHVMIPL